MTQLFDTATYEHLDPTVDAPGSASGRRHLRSLPTGDDPASRSAQWRLDDQTIEIGRKGIQAARQALQAAARTTSTTKRRAAA